MSKSVLKNMKFSKKQIDYISKMIKNHLYPSQVICAPDLSEKAYMRYIRKIGDDVIDNIILAKSDRMSALGEAVTKETVENNINGLNKLLNFYLEIKETLQPLPKLLSGNEIMELTGLTQCKKLGEIIKSLQELQISGTVNTKSEAIDFVKSYLNKASQ